MEVWTVEVEKLFLMEKLADKIEQIASARYLIDGDQDLINQMRKTAREALRMIDVGNTPLQGPYWTIRDPDGHLVHTVLWMDREDAIKDFMDTEQAMNWVSNCMRCTKGMPQRCTQSWELFEAEGYSTVQAYLTEKILCPN